MLNHPVYMCRLSFLRAMYGGRGGQGGGGFETYLKQGFFFGGGMEKIKEGVINLFISFILALFSRCKGAGCEGGPLAPLNSPGKC